MNSRVHCLALIAVLLGQTGGVSGPITYCLDGGELCCVGWGAEICCEEGAGDPAGPCYGDPASCADVEADSNGGLVSFAARIPQPSPVAVGCFPLAEPPAPDRATGSGEMIPGSAPPDPHLETTVLRI